MRASDGHQVRSSSSLVTYYIYIMLLSPGTSPDLLDIYGIKLRSFFLLLPVVYRLCFISKDIPDLLDVYGTKPPCNFHKIVQVEQSHDSHSLPLTETAIYDRQYSRNTISVQHAVHAQHSVRSKLPSGLHIQTRRIISDQAVGLCHQVSLEMLRCREQAKHSAKTVDESTGQ
ncbi:hypothetical protein MAP00_004540 [Monascus purpureus]|nr:hypothetical protein MAP00_004540 [Monascus purpureus]